MGCYFVSNLKGHIKNILSNMNKFNTNMSISLPKLTIIGHSHIFVENYEGLVLFTNDQLKLQLHQGYVLIKGNHFVLKTLFERELLLEGTITHIEYIN